MLFQVGLAFLGWYQSLIPAWMPWMPAVSLQIIVVVILTTLFLVVAVKAKKHVSVVVLSAILFVTPIVLNLFGIVAVVWPGHP